MLTKANLHTVRLTCLLEGRLSHLFCVPMNDLHEPAFRGFFNFAEPFAPQVLHVLSQSQPFSGIHVDMILVLDVLIVHFMCLDANVWMPAHDTIRQLSNQRLSLDEEADKERPQRCARSSKMFHEMIMKFFRVTVNDTVRIETKKLHLPTMAIRCEVTLKTIFITALFLTHLTVPFQFSQTLRFDAIGYLQIKRYVYDATHFKGSQKKLR